MTIHPIIIGNAGTITAETLRAFEVLGLSPVSGLKLAKHLALASIKRTAEIKRAKLSHAAAPQGTAQAENGEPATDPGTSTGAAPSQPPQAPDDVDPPGRLPSELPGEASPSCPTRLPVTQADTASPHGHDASAEPTEDADGWHIVSSTKRSARASRAHTTLELQGIQALVCSRPDRACSGREGRTPSWQICQRTDRLQTRHHPLLRADRSAAGNTTTKPAPPVVPPTSEPASAEPLASRRDEASVLPLPCPTETQPTAPAAVACVPTTDSLPTSVHASGRRRKKPSNAQAPAALYTAEPHPQGTDRHSQVSRSKRKADSQPTLQPTRRSTRQRTSTRVFDPSDPAATAGYVQRRGASPDMQSSLPFDPG